MKLVNVHVSRRFLCFVFLSSIMGVSGCRGSSEAPTPNPPGKPAPGEFDGFKLRINGKDALDGKTVLTVGNSFQVKGQFHFVKPYKGHAPTDVFIVKLDGAEEGKSLGGRAESGHLKFIGNRRATFSCEVPEPLKAGEYTLTVVDHRFKIIMQTNVRVEE